MANRKVSYEVKPVDDDFLAGIKNPTVGTNETQDTTAVESKTASAPATTGSKKVLFNFKIHESLLQDLRNYCESNYMTVTAGITKAIIQMLRDDK